MSEHTLDEKEKINHLAYVDVLEVKEPSMSTDNYYMQCYRFLEIDIPVLYGGFS